VEPEEAAIARHWAGKYASVATGMLATIEELRDAVLSVQSMPRL
jgi:hypothetical protein